MRRISLGRMLLPALATLFAAALALPARADWAILRNGRSLHITGYERQGSLYVLQMAGGEVRLPVSAVLRFEPETLFPSPVVEPAQPSGPFSALVHRAALQNGLSPRLLSSVIRVESDFHPRAVSPKHALGLMQLMPSTARALAVRDPFDPAQNVQGGAHYLKQLLGKFGNVNLALAAYNAGPAAIRSYGGVPPFPETRDYIARVRRDMKRPSAPHPKTGAVELTCAPREQRCREQSVSGARIPDRALP
ncbi:MAG TPA: lytic transglycosylase domain-containing protein [Candidatus Dormibacteraeota bacterium]|nr:lytic transglycosylase domain-containing protein [Candidatus Dormibacteraeota bacterium]